MKYIDPLYGEVEFNQPILLDLMGTTAMQRLKGVLQHGITGLIGVTRATSRFEHSLGVMILVQRFGAPIEEQIAAMLHDVSHTAFSHVIDYVFNEHNSQSYHEQMKEEYVAGTDIPAVLAKHGYNWRDFLEEDNFPLLEQPSPALCADRLDYFLRDSRDLGLASDGEVQVALNHLVLYNQRIVMDDLDAARWVGEGYLTCDEMSWANFREIALYELTARLIKTSLNLGVLTEDDLWSTDQHAWDKLKSCKYPSIQEQIKLIDPQTQFVWDEESPTFRVGAKLRTIDPDVLHNGRSLRLSQLDPLFARRRAQYIQRKSGQWPVRVVQFE
jgi:HD superfamily phosphohydrolase